MANLSVSLAQAKDKIANNIVVSAVIGYVNQRWVINLQPSHPSPTPPPPDKTRRADHVITQLICFFTSDVHSICEQHKLLEIRSNVIISIMFIRQPNIQKLTIIDLIFHLVSFTIEL